MSNRVFSIIISGSLFFSLLVGANAEEKTVQIQLPEAKYTLAKATYEDLPAVLLINEALDGFSGKEAFPWHLRIFMQINNANNKGMPSPKESHKLFDFAEEIEGKLKSKTSKDGALNSLFVARETWNGWVIVDFQIHDPEIADNVLKNLIKETNEELQKSSDIEDSPVKWEYKMAADPSWSKTQHYFVLTKEAK